MGKGIFYRHGQNLQSCSSSQVYLKIELNKSCSSSLTYYDGGRGSEKEEEEYNSSAGCTFE